MAVVTREYTDESGRQLREYESGTVLDAVTGKIVRGAPVPEERWINSGNAAALAHTRWHKAGQDAYIASTRKALAARNDDAVLDIIEQASGASIGILMDEIVYSKDVRPDWRIKGDEHARAHSGMDGRAPKQAASSGPDTTTITIANDLIRDIVAAAMRRGDG